MTFANNSLTFCFFLGSTGYIASIFCVYSNVKFSSAISICSMVRVYCSLVIKSFCCCFFLDPPYLSSRYFKNTLRRYSTLSTTCVLKDRLLRSASWVTLDVFKCSEPCSSWCFEPPTD